MNEFEPVKKKIHELLEIARQFVNSRLEKLVRRVNEVFDPKGRNFNLRILIAGILLCVTIGFFFGFRATKVEAVRKPPLPGSVPGDKFPFFNFHFGKKDFFPGSQADGSFVFSNFEKPEDVRSWDLIEAQVAPSTQYAWEGSFSGKVSFLRGKDLAVVTLDDLGRTKKQPSDWSRYGSLHFYVFQPGNQPEILNLMVTDLWGKKYEETISVPRGIWAEFAIPTARMASSLNLKKINQFSISRRGSKEAIDFYLDDIRLLPAQASNGPLSRENIFDYGFSKRKPAWTVSDRELKSEVVQVPFIVRNETHAFCHLCPVEGGMPLPMGELQDLGHIRIRNAYGEDIPFQAKPLAHWPDRSVKWLGVHFESTLASQEGAGFFLDYGPTIRSLDFASPLQVTEDSDRVTINTGVLEARLSKKSFYLFEQLTVDRNTNGVFESHEVMTSRAALTLMFRGTEFRTDLDRETYEVVVEEKGSQKAVVKASGWYQSEDGRRYCQAIVRYYFYVGKSYVKISHTLVYTGYPENKQYDAYSMLRLPENETIEAYGLRLPYAFSEKGDERVFVGLAQAAPMALTAGGSIELFQQDYDLAWLKRDGEPIHAGDHFGGWLDISTGEGGVAVALRHFRKNFPKAYRMDRSRGELLIDLWPREAGALDLSTTPKAVGTDAYGRGNAFGLAKTHDLLLYFHKGNAAQSNAINTAASFMEPLIVRTNPYWIDATGALGRLFPADQKYATEEQMLERLFNWAERQPRNFKWYGMLNFGDTLTWWRDADDDETGGQKYQESGWHPVGRWGWYNCEGVGTHTGALLQFARSGKWKYFEFGENLAKHVMDVDTVHYDTVKHDKRIHGSIDERSSHPGAMHRHNGDHWGGRTDEASHTNVLGILLYYYLSGNERAFDVAKEVGAYFLTEPFTYMGHPDVAPNRAMSNALWGDILLYQATWDGRYKKAADKIVKVFVKGQQQDGSFLENYNPILGTWSGAKHELYMTGYALGALMSYHELTQDETVKETFLKLVRYLARREFSGPVILHGLAYAYLVTKDPFFIVMIESNLKSIMSHQQFSTDSLRDGLIYDKPIYHRPMAFLSTVPYVFGALEEKFNLENS